jgi:hypothetical protein
LIRFFADPLTFSIIELSQMAHAEPVRLLELFLVRESSMPAWRLFRSAFRQAPGVLSSPLRAGYAVSQCSDHEIPDENGDLSDIQVYGENGRPYGRCG